MASSLSPTDHTLHHAASQGHPGFPEQLDFYNEGFLSGTIVFEGVGLQGHKNMSLGLAFSNRVRVVHQGSGVDCDA